MNRLLCGLAAAFAVAAAGSAQAAMTQQECDAAWKQANPQNLEKLPEASAAAYITDMKAVNPDGDGTIEAKEFTDACSKGLVKMAAAAGGKAPAAGETSDRTPEKATDTPADQKDTSGGDTSDRTPEKK